MKYGIKIAASINPQYAPYWGEAPFDTFKEPKYHKSDRTFITNDINAAFKCRNEYQYVYGSEWIYLVEERQ